MHEEIVTASETSEDERLHGVSRAKVFQADPVRKLVEEKKIPQAPLVETYMSEQEIEQVRHKPRRRVTKEVIRYEEVTESDSADEIIKIKQPIAKQRTVNQPDKIVKVVEEIP